MKLFKDASTISETSVLDQVMVIVCRLTVELHSDGGKVGAEDIVELCSRNYEIEGALPIVGAVHPNAYGKA